MMTRPQNSKSMLALDILTESMREAANEASIADGVISSSYPQNNDSHPSHSHINSAPENKIKKTELRRGKWTPEEEAYANRLIEEFKNGMLPIADGTTLRTFLSKLLNCDPMRISKKYVGNNCIGKQVYRQKHGDLDDIPPEVLERNKIELEELERQFMDRSKQTTSSRSRANRSDSAKPQRHKPEEPRIARDGPPSVPWIPAHPSYPITPDSNPYSHQSPDFQNLPKNPYHGNGFGYPNRPSEIDLSYLPDAFASTSSLDLLGTIAEMKLPSGKSLENLHKHGLEGVAASTASLGDWYSMFPDNTNGSMTDLQSASRNIDPPQNRLMPWDLNGSSTPSANGLRNNNNNGSNGSNGNGNNLKHSLSRELLQAAADAVAHDEAQTELEKLVKLQQLQKSKQEAFSNSNMSGTVASLSSPPSAKSTSPSAPSVVDARRSSSIENFMMLVDMGDIPKPDSSILLKNIFNDSTNSSSSSNLAQSNPTPSSSSNNKRTLEPLREEAFDYGDLKRARPDSFQEQQSSAGSTAHCHDDDHDDDDSLVDARLLSAAVVRRPFT